MLDCQKTAFATLGEYFMGQQMGALHCDMNTMVAQMMDKRISGCDPTAVYPAQGGMGSMPMMNLHRMNAGHSHFGGFGRALMLLWWALAITAVVAITSWLLSPRKSQGSGFA